MNVVLLLVSLMVVLPLLQAPRAVPDDATATCITRVNTYVTAATTTIVVV
jgi:hypothetical protein